MGDWQALMVFHQPSPEPTRRDRLMVMLCPYFEICCFPYWELLAGMSLVIAARVVSDGWIQETSKQDESDLRLSSTIMEFSLLYFSIVNGWFFYAHHMGSRLDPVIPMHSTHMISLWIYLGFSFLAAANAQDSGMFSMCMVGQRFPLMIMCLTLACSSRTPAYFGLLAFFTGDSILCYGLAGQLSREAYQQNGSSRNPEFFLWGAAAVMELMVDIFLAIALTASNRLTYRLEHTMHQFGSVFLAPLGGLAIQTVSILVGPSWGNDDEENNETKWLQLVSSWVLLVLLSMLYWSQLDDVYCNMRDQPTISRAILLVLLKLLGLPIWLVGACLQLFLVADNDAGFTTAACVFETSIGAALMLLLCFKLMSGRLISDHWLMLLWLVAAAASFVAHFPESSTSLSFYLVLLSTLSLADACSQWITSTQAQPSGNWGGRFDQEVRPSERQRLLPP